MPRKYPAVACDTQSGSAAGLTKASGDPKQNIPLTANPFAAEEFLKSFARVIRFEPAFSGILLIIVATAPVPADILMH
jgi:hypothetical protein